MDKKHCQIHLCVKSVCAQRAEPLQISQSDKSGEDENVFNESITFRIKLVTFATKLFFFLNRSLPRVQHHHGNKDAARCG